MGAPGHEYITAEALTPMLHQMKDEIVQEVTAQVSARLSTEITSHLINILDQKIDTVVRPIRDDVKTDNERVARHSKQLSDLILQIASQAEHDKRMADMQQESNRQIATLVKTVDSLMNMQTNLQRMSEFHNVEISEARNLADRANDRMDKHVEDAVRIRNEMNTNIATLSATMLEMNRSDVNIRADVAGIKAGLAEQREAMEQQRELVESLNSVFDFFRTRGKKVLAVIATIAVAQGDNIGRAIVDLLGG